VIVGVIATDGDSNGTGAVNPGEVVDGTSGMSQPAVTVPAFGTCGPAAASCDGVIVGVIAGVVDGTSGRSRPAGPAAGVIVGVIAADGGSDGGCGAVNPGEVVDGTSGMSQPAVTAAFGMCGPAAASCDGVIVGVIAADGGSNGACGAVKPGEVVDGTSGMSQPAVTAPGCGTGGRTEDDGVFETAGARSADDGAIVRCDSSGGRSDDEGTSV
jgi:hypothetical protein